MDYVGKNRELQTTFANQDEAGVGLKKNIYYILICVENT